MEEKKINYPKDFINLLAREISTARSKLTSYKPGTEQDRGEDEGRVSYLGVKAELVARWWLLGLPNNNKDNFRWSPIIDTKPFPGPDLDICTKLYDIKGRKDNNSPFFINAESHQNPSKRVDTYLFITIPEDSDTAYIHLFEYDAVSKWTLKQSKKNGSWYYILKEGFRKEEGRE